jgi:hypothetical protein
MNYRLILNEYYNHIPFHVTNELISHWLRQLTAHHKFATGVTQRTDLTSQGQYNYKLFEIHCQIFNILERTRHLPMLNYKTNVHIDMKAGIAVIR